MIHPLFTRLVTQPGLFAEHAGAYAELAAAEAQQLGLHWKRQLLLTAAAGILGLLGVGLAGVALLLACFSVRADVFMWKDPATGKTRMTNIEPPWLRNSRPGVRIPKVEVIRDGKVMDPAAAFAQPEPPPQPLRRRPDEETAGAGRTGAGESPTAPKEILLPPGAQLPSGAIPNAITPDRGTSPSAPR